MGYTKPDGTPKKLLDVSRINKLGWNAQISLDLGLTSTIKTFQSDLGIIILIHFGINQSLKTTLYSMGIHKIHCFRSRCG